MGAGRRRPGWGRIGFASLLSFLLFAHLISIYTENINWDEFALLARARDTLQTGRLHAGGRPGLAVLLLLPFVEHCSDEVASIRAARWLWAGFSVALVWGYWTFLRRFFRRDEWGWDSAALGVGLLILVPVVLRFSIQVRTDQAAIACGIWGGVALLASRQRKLWSVVAGVLFGVGYLFTQKLLYVAALVGLLGAGELLIRNEFRIPREAARSCLCLLAALAVTLVYEAWLPHAFAPPAAPTFEGGMNVFAFYRTAIGFRYYVEMLPTLVPHLVLGALLVWASTAALRPAGRWRRHLLLAWAVLGLGLVVGAFHAGAFPYFWMTLGLFPATAGALALEPIRGRYARLRDRRIVLRSLWAFLVVQSLLTALALMRDTQAIQRDSLAFISRNFSPDDQGFHPERATFCREEPRPFPTFFSQTIASRFYGPDREQNVAAMIAEFRNRPVKFILESWRLQQFPTELREFWAEHYQPYWGSVMLPARSLRGREGERRDFEIIVPGTFRWRASAAGGEAPLRVDGQLLVAGDTIPLAAGIHTAEFLRDLEGSLLLAVPDAPGRSGKPFYKSHHEIGSLWGRDVS